MFVDNVEDQGLERGAFAFTSTFAEMCGFEKSARLPPDTVRGILDALALKPRKTWAATPDGFAARDWHPWRFRRRLSVICRPILQLRESPEPQYLVAPSLLRDGCVKLIDYCFCGGLEAKDFPAGRMRSWIGADENGRGHKFTEDVSTRLRELGWQTKVNVTLTGILNDRLDRNYGDVDVLAWRGERALAVECKELELAMTVSDIAHQLSSFRGESGADGKPDRLKRHLNRVELLNLRRDAVQKYVRSSSEVTIDAVLIFSEIVPMSYSRNIAGKGVRFATFEELGTL